MCALRGPLASSRPVWTCLDLASPCLTKRSRGLNPIKPFVAPTKWEQNETNWDKMFNCLRCLTDASSAHTPYSCLSQALLGTFNQTRTAEQHRIAIRFAAQTDLGHIMSSSDSSMQKWVPDSRHCEDYGLPKTCLGVWRREGISSEITKQLFREVNVLQILWNCWHKTRCEICEHEQHFVLEVLTVCWLLTMSSTLPHMVAYCHFADSFCAFFVLALWCVCVWVFECVCVLHLGF